MVTSEAVCEGWRSCAEFQTDLSEMIILSLLLSYNKF